MPVTETLNDIDADFDILEIVGEHVDTMIAGLVSNGAMQKTLRQWLSGHARALDGEGPCLMGMAADLELFAPSMSGRTAVDRYLNARQPKTDAERQAFEALRSARFQLVRIVGRENADLVEVKDLVSGENLMVLDARISPDAAGMPTAMRLCPLASGRNLLTSPLYAIDEAQLAQALTYVRPGRGLGDGHRCAGHLYRDVARRGVLPVPIHEPELDEDEVLEALSQIADRLSPVEHLAMRWLHGGQAQADLIQEARQMASADNLIDACGLFGQTGPDAPDGMKEIFERIADLQTETLVLRRRLGADGPAGEMNIVAAAIADHIAKGNMETSAGDLFHRLKTRWTLAPSPRQGVAAAELDAVIQRIRGLRAKTVDRGCTEEEAMAAAAKVSELLARHDLTLDEVTVRESECEGIKVSTGRKRRAPADSCVQAVADFCDCRVWSEENADGVLRYVFFGLRVDVEAARFLHDLVETTFETESDAFRCGNIYRGLRGGHRRTALNSFQVGLANGISARLETLKEVRNGSTGRSTGFDLVAVKHSVVDEEVSRLGLNLTARTTSSRRLVHEDSYALGKAKGALFEPHTLVDA